MQRICVFCGSRAGASTVFADAARALGTLLAERGLGVVYGGGNVGLMGVLADAALAAGGEVIGVIPHGLEKRELAHPGVRDMRVVRSMHDRKALMADLADGFLALPGGFGTLEEFFEVLTWGQLGIHRKPCGLLNVGGYWNPMLSLFERMQSEEFTDALNRSLVLVDDSPVGLLTAMNAYESPITDHWLEPEET